MKKSFRTEIKIKPQTKKVSIQDSFVSMGSCFADNLTLHQQRQKLKAEKDPFGIAFNPITIAQRITNSLKEVSFHENELIENNGLFFHFGAHSSINSQTQKELSQRLIEGQKSLKKSLTSCDFLVLTFGSSFVHQLNENGLVVANCHKQNPLDFTKKLLNHEEIYQALFEAISLLSRHNPALQIILTVSPVRHTREGLSENSLSKSILRTSCHSLEERFGNVTYFPSYEIMLDDLRSYRFYEADLIHPNDQATAYIFDLFEKAFYDENLQNHLTDWVKIKQRLSHKPLHPSSTSYKVFLETLLRDLTTYPFQVELDDELTKIQEAILALDNLS